MGKSMEKSFFEYSTLNFSSVAPEEGEEGTIPENKDSRPAVDLKILGDGEIMVEKKTLIDFFELIMDGELEDDMVYSYEDVKKY